MNLQVSSFIQEIFLEFWVQIYPFGLLLCFSDLQNIFVFKALFSLWIFISIIQASSLGSLYRISTELGSKDWEQPANFSLKGRILILSTAAVLGQIARGLHTELVLVALFTIDVYITIHVMKSSLLLREKVEAKRATQAKNPASLRTSRDDFDQK